MDTAKTMELLSTLMIENMSLLKEIEELKSKVVPGKVKKVKEVDPNKPKKKYGKLDEEALKKSRHENGMRLAAWRKAKKESESESGSGAEETAIETE